MVKVVVVEVKDGVVEVVELPPGIRVVIRDHDANEEACFYPGEKGPEVVRRGALKS